MSIFYEKNVHSLKNTVLSCHYFQIFHEKPNSVSPIFVQKNVNSVITTLQYGTKKSIGCPFFSIFHEKIIALMPIFCQKNVHSLKNTMLSCPYFVEKTSIPIINCDFDPKTCHKCSSSLSSESRFFISTIIQSSFDRIDVFDQIWASQQGVTHDKFE